MFRPRMLVAIVVAGAGLATAVWLPTRNDTAAASDRDRGNHSSRDDRRYDRDDDGGRRGDESWRGDGGWRGDEGWRDDRDRRDDGRERGGRNGDDRDPVDPTPTVEAPTPPPGETGEPTAPPVTEPPATEPPATEPPATEPPAVPPTTPPATDPVAVVTEWKPFVDYVEGDVVRFDGVAYRILQSHTSLPGWEPAALTVIFKPLL